MEYYILKKYEEEKSKDDEIEKGFKRFSNNVKRLIYLLFVIMAVACTEIIITLFIFPNPIWQLIGMLCCIVSAFAVVFIGERDLKENLDDYVASYSKKIDILYRILKENFSVDTKDKLDILISKYQSYIDEKHDEEKKRNKLIFTIFSGFVGVLSILFSNLDMIGMDFIDWLNVGTFLIIIISAISACLYSFKYTDTLQKKYKNIMLELVDVKLIKY